MAPVFSTDQLNFTLQPQSDTWSIRTISQNLRIMNASMALTWREAGRTHTTRLEISRAEKVAEEQATHSLGPANHLTLRIPINPTLDAEVCFSLLHSSPTMLMVAGSEERNDKLSGVHFSSPEVDLAFYSNGWQSWSYAGLVGADQKMPGTRLGPIRRTMIDQPGTRFPRGRGKFHSDMFGVLLDRNSHTGILVGFLSQSAAFGTVESCLDGAQPSLHLRVKTSSQIGLALISSTRDPVTPCQHI
jgi:hypothetical protein